MARSLRMNMWDSLRAENRQATWRWHGRICPWWWIPLLLPQDLGQWFWRHGLALDMARQIDTQIWEQYSRNAIVAHLLQHCLTCLVILRWTVWSMYWTPIPKIHSTPLCSAANASCIVLQDIRTAFCLSILPGEGSANFQTNPLKTRIESKIK